MRVKSFNFEKGYCINTIYSHNTILQGVRSIKHITRWFKRVMSEYQRIIESASVEGRSIVNLRRDRQRGR